MQSENLRENFRALTVGDIFLATYPGIGGERGTAICLVVAVRGDRIEARTVTTQWSLGFDRSSLKATLPSGTVFTVVHAQPLPPEVHSVLVGLDNRYFAGGEPTLTDDEKHALLSVAGILR